MKQQQEIRVGDLVYAERRGKGNILGVVEHLPRPDPRLKPRHQDHQVRLRREYLSLGEPIKVGTRYYPELTRGKGMPRFYKNSADYFVGTAAIARALRSKGPKWEIFAEDIEKCDSLSFLAEGSSNP